MKNAIKRGVSAVLLVFGITSLTGCFYYRHDRDYGYGDRDWSYRDYSYDRYHRNWDDGYAYGPRHPDWNYD